MSEMNPKILHSPFNYYTLPLSPSYSQNMQNNLKNYGRLNFIKSSLKSNFFCVGNLVECILQREYLKLELQDWYSFHFRFQAKPKIVALKF